MRPFRRIVNKSLDDFHLELENVDEAEEENEKDPFKKIPPTKI
jgi:hypothetical protein